jgi:CheY-like chemotaxis protein
MKQILVIDDTPIRLMWFQATLENPSCKVILASSADAALIWFKETTFDLVFFDHDLGFGMDGSQLAYHILSHPEEFKAPKAVWIHTCNPEGTTNIAAKFKSAGIRYYAEAYANCIEHKHDFKATAKALLDGVSLPVMEGY